MPGTSIIGPSGQAGSGKLGTRSRAIVALSVVFVVVLVSRLAWLQTVKGPELAALAQQQRTRVYDEFARRGSIEDTDGRVLAYTMRSRSLTTSPNVLRAEAAERHTWNPKVNPPPEEYLSTIAHTISEKIAGSGASARDVDPEEILDKLNKDSGYEVLVRNVDPDIAAAIAAQFQGIAADRQDVRVYPNGAIGENIIGKTSADGDGQFGYEAWADSTLSGSDGSVTEEVSADGQTIPGTLRDRIPVINGSDATLTIDLDVQTFVQQQIEQAKANSGAEHVSAVVLDAKTAKVVAMANTGTIDPTGDIIAQRKRGKSFGNPAISDPFEPGSVAKIITAAAAIEDGKTTPDEVLEVPGSIRMAGVTVHDAWNHGLVNYTTTGVFGKSSNVGTLLLAQRVGEDRFADMLTRFGIGQPTHIELPGESQGLLPDRSQWSGGTFANLPIGQGMSLTLLQMAGVYQAIANDGVRIEPRIVEKITTPDGTVIPADPAPQTRVVSGQTAQTVRTIFQAVTQNDPTGINRGTGPAAAVDGYQIAGKTGTAQQVDPNCNCYSNSMYWITFAGIAPADDPRFVIAIMMDKPQRGPHGEGGQSAAPLFHDIAAWLLNHYNVALSPPREGPEQLTLHIP
ncbi:peptidoglycan D,D-transpeptidase FtsI family protein [Corynebacterium mendelii]|uniref:peptidoglycan D,D-transpeptidase FtsI family protein n=1 Tax=Corynebacterium mendelii TaxID=2765362 RepID=UPI003634747D